MPSLTVYSRTYFDLWVHWCPLVVVDKSRESSILVERYYGLHWYYSAVQDEAQTLFGMLDAKMLSGGHAPSQLGSWNIRGC